MKKRNAKPTGMRVEYDFASMKGAVRGKYAKLPPNRSKLRRIQENPNEKIQKSRTVDSSTTSGRHRNSI